MFHSLPSEPLSLHEGVDSWGSQSCSLKSDTPLVQHMWRPSDCSIHLYLWIHMHPNACERNGTLCLRMYCLGLFASEQKRWAYCHASSPTCSHCVGFICAVRVCVRFCVCDSVDVIKAFLECRKKRMGRTTKKKVTPTYLFPPLQFCSFSFCCLPLSNNHVHRSLLFPPCLSPFLSLSDFLFKTHMTLCQIMLLDLAGSCVFLLTLFPLFFIPALESHLINRSTLSHTYHRIYT